MPQVVYFVSSCIDKRRFMGGISCVALCNPCKVLAIGQGFDYNGNVLIKANMP